MRKIIDNFRDFGLDLVVLALNGGRRIIWAICAFVALVGCAALLFIALGILEKPEGITFFLQANILKAFGICLIIVICAWIADRLELLKEEEERDLKLNHYLGAGGDLKHLEDF